VLASFQPEALRGSIDRYKIALRAAWMRLVHQGADRDLLVLLMAGAGGTARTLTGRLIAVWAKASTQLQTPASGIDAMESHAPMMS
jgi:hypothetical protein